MAANAIAPSGFQTLRRYDGTNPNYAMREETIAYNYGSRINYGDPVFRNASGQIALYVAGGTTIHGIFRGCRYLDPGTLKTEFYPAWRTPSLPSTTTVFALIDQDPWMTLMCQNVGTAMNNNMIGSNCDITAASSGSTSSLAGLSICSLAAGTSPVTTATLPFRIQSIIGLTGQLSGGLVTPVINAAYSPLNDNQWLEVTFNTPDITTRTGQA